MGSTWMDGVRLKAFGIAGCTLASLLLAAHVSLPMLGSMLDPPGQKPERLYLQPFRGFPDSAVAELTEHFEQRFPQTRDLRITVLPARPLPVHAWDPRRGALVAEEVIRLIRRENSLVAANPRSVILGLTTIDISSRQGGLVWAWRDHSVGVVSSAMFGPTLLGDAPAAELTRRRFRKIVAKSVAALYYRLRPSGNPQSVLYHWLDSVADVDRVREAF